MNYPEKHQESKFRPQAAFLDADAQQRLLNRYFAKFVKRWNNLTLPVEYYRPHASTSSSASSQTAYKWSFANNRSKVDKTELAKLRQDVDALTNGRNDSHSKPQQGPSRPPPPPSSSSGRQIGPIMPISTAFSANHADRQLALENRREDVARERKAERNKLLGRAEDMVPKSSGREGKMDEKRAINAENRKYREKDASAGMEMDESTLMGGGSDFQQAYVADSSLYPSLCLPKSLCDLYSLAQREAANARRQERRAHSDMDRRSGMSERLQTMKAKDDQTMAMFRQLAQSKFGGQ